MPKMRQLRRVIIHGGAASPPAGRVTLPTQKNSPEYEWTEITLLIQRATSFCSEESPSPIRTRSIIRAIGTSSILSTSRKWAQRSFAYRFIPLPGAARTPEEYLPLLDQAVQWCTDLDLHVIIDWHSIGNLKMELFQNPMYDTTERETYEFWRTIARHFNGNNTVAFYELFNEPTTFRGQLGSVSWSDWKKINENMINLIRAYDKEKIPLVAGFDWAYDLTPLLIEPIQAEGIGYVTHPYPNKRSRPWEPKWEEDFGFAAAHYPIIATEIGFSVPQGTAVGDNDYGNLITRYLEGKGISWVAWDFDPEWGPRLLNSWNYDLTGSGEFFKQAMHREIAKPK